MFHTMSFALLFAVLTCGQIASAQFNQLGKCPAVKIPNEFRWAKFIGGWFEYARYQNSLEARWECVYQNYQPLGLFSFGVNISGVLFSTLQTFETTGNITGKGIFSLTGLGGPNRTYKIVGADNKSWAVIYSCEEAGKLRKEMGWILTRKRNPNQETVDKAWKVLDQIGVSQKDLQIIRQRNC